VAWSPLLLTLLAHCTGSWAQAVLTQPPSESGSLGQRVTLSCTGSSSNIGGGNSVNWSQPLPGKVPRSVFTYANLMAIAAPDQISGFKSGSSGTLTITGLQAEDDAEYYCTAGGDSLDGPTVPQARGQVRPKPAVPQPGAWLLLLPGAETEPWTPAPLWRWPPRASCSGSRRSCCCCPPGSRSSGALAGVGRLPSPLSSKSLQLPLPVHLC
uniref:Ig-like domain-containing protein n=1 Tax=Sus scrofa TaxID=9823 RepID=A0A8D1NRV3_PIG